MSTGPPRQTRGSGRARSETLAPGRAVSGQDRGQATALQLALRDSDRALPNRGAGALPSASLVKPSHPPSLRTGGADSSVDRRRTSVRKEGAEGVSRAVTARLGGGGVENLRADVGAPRPVKDRCPSRATATTTGDFLRDQLRQKTRAILLHNLRDEIRDRHDDLLLLCPTLPNRDRSSFRFALTDHPNVGGLLHLAVADSIG